MDNQRWERIQALFHEAVARPESDRRAFLESACGGADDLMAEVLTMLNDDSATSSLLDRGIASVAYLAGSPFDSDLIREFGPYRLLRLLGEGGMGVVWLAERKDAGNLVAIKFLPHAALSPARRERFASEIRTLARLRHPFIARLYDAGALSDGTPWFVMEFVDGQRFSDYLRARDIAIAQRLHLFRNVCEAVQYAHSQEVIHRDLKPSNIMVEKDGTPRLLDFGIARELHSLDDPANHTRQGLRFMSPDYAAPEWIQHGIVGFGTDVYSLGVILYEVLAGRLPFDRPGAASANEIPENYTEPAKPSVVASREADAQRARGAIASIPKAEWNDLDVLCLKAIHRDPGQRYRSVEALIRDINRYLKGEPLEARPDALQYRVTKFVRRNRRAVIAASLAFALIAGQIVYFTVHLARARDAAVAEAARTKRIQRFMLTLFGSGDQAAPSNELRVVSLLDRGARQAATLNADPETQAELYKTLGTMYLLLGKYPKADGLLQSAVERMKTAVGPANPGVADTLIQLGLLRGHEARFQDAERLVRQGIDLASRLPADDPVLVNAHWALGQVLDQSGAYDKAIAVLEPVVRIKPSGEEGAIVLADSLTALGYAHQYKGQYDLAESFARRALAMDRKLFGESHPRVAFDLTNIGTAEVVVGRSKEAEDSYRQALEIVKTWYGPDHPEASQIASFLAQALSRQGKYAEAEPLLQHALTIEEQAKGKDHPDLAFVLDMMGKLAINRGDLAAADADFSRSLSINKASFGDGQYQTAIEMVNLGDVFVKEKRYAQAETLLRAAIGVLSAHPFTGNVSLAVGQVALGRALLRQRRYRDAEQYLNAGYAVFSKQPERGPARLRESREDLAELYAALHQSEKAGEFRTQLAGDGARRLK